MKRCCQGRKRALVILLAVAMSLAVRLPGITHGSPRWVFHPDVPKQALYAQQVYRGDDNPRHLAPADDSEGFQVTAYPYGTSYLAGKAARIGEGFAGTPGLYGDRNTFFWALLLRILNLLSFAAALAVALVFLAGRLNLPLLALSGLLLALEPFHAQYARYGMNDIPMLGLLMVAWAGSAFMSLPGRLRLPAAALVGFCLGAGFGIKYNAVLGFLFPGILWAFWIFEKRWRAVLGTATVTLTCFLLGTWTTCPLLWQEPAYFAREFPRFMHWQSHILRYRNVTDGLYHMEAPAKLARNALWTGRHYLQTGLFLLFPALPWGLSGLRRRGGSSLSTLSAATASVFFLLVNLVLIIARDIMRPNDLLLATPFLLMLFGLFLHEKLALWKREGRTGRAGGALALSCGLLLMFGSAAARDSLAFRREDTRLRAAEWMKNNLGPGRMLRERYTFFQKVPGLEVWRFSFLSDQAPRHDLIEKGAFTYLMASSLAYERFRDPLSVFFSEDVKDFYDGLAGRFEVLAEFRDRELLANHPVITIYGRP